MLLHKNKLFYLELGAKVTQNVAQYHLHHVTYAPSKFEIARSSGLGRGAFTRKLVIWRQGHIKCCPVPSTSCGLHNCNVSAHLSRRLMGKLIVYQSLRRPSFRRPSTILTNGPLFGT